MDNHHQQMEEQPYLLHDHLLHHHWPPLQGQQQQLLQHQHQPQLQHQHQPYLLHHHQQLLQHEDQPLLQHQHQQHEDQSLLQHQHQPYLLHHHEQLLQHQHQPLLQHQHQPYVLHHQQHQVQQGEILHENSQNLLDSMPSGYRFCPTDQELIVHYLKKRIADAPLPLNRIHEANVYSHTPEELANMYSSDSFHNVNGWYFFTYLTKKYPNGSRPSRSCRDVGFWKPTGKDKKIYYNGNTVGCRKSLDFLLGRQPGEKTAWKMHEYRILATNSKPDLVLCRLYMNLKRKKEDENEGDTGELVREDLDQCLIVNEAPMQNEENDLVFGNTSSAGSTKNQCMEYITSALDTRGDASSNQVVHDVPIFQFPRPFQDLQG